MSLDIPEMISAYKCGKCSALFENKGDSREAIEHCRKPVLEIPAGFVLTELFAKDIPMGVLVVGKRIRITSGHVSVHQVSSYNFSDKSLSNPDLLYPTTILAGIGNKTYRFLTPGDLDKFYRIREDLTQKLQLSERFITDPEGIPAFEKLLEEAQ